MISLTCPSGSITYHLDTQDQKRSLPQEIIDNAQFILSQTPQSLKSHEITIEISEKIKEIDVREELKGIAVQLLTSLDSLGYMLPSANRILNCPASDQLQEALFKILVDVNEQYQQNRGSKKLPFVVVEIQIICLAYQGQHRDAQKMFCNLFSFSNALQETARVECLKSLINYALLRKSPSPDKLLEMKRVFQ